MRRQRHCWDLKMELSNKQANKRLQIFRLCSFPGGTKCKGPVAQIAISMRPVIMSKAKKNIHAPVMENWVKGCQDTGNAKFSGLAIVSQKEVTAS